MGKIAAKPRQRNKAIAFDYDFIRAQATDTCIYCLTDQQVTAIQTMLEYLGWRTRWFSLVDTAIDQDWISAFEAELETRFMPDECTNITDKLNHIVDLLDEIKVDFDLSQAGQDLALAALATDLTGISGALALVSTAVAGIATIVTSTQGTVNEMSDDVDHIEAVVTDSTDGLVEVSQDVDNIELLVEKIGNKQTTIINNTTITVNLNLPDQTFTSDSSDQTSVEVYARYNALCSAIVSWILLEGYALLDVLGAGLTDLNTAKAIIDADVFYYAYLLTPGAPTFSIATILGAMVDSAAVDDVACAMITYLANLPPTYANFVAALDTYTPPALPDNRAVLHDALVVCLDGLDAWTGFAPILEASYQQELALNPTGFTCVTCAPSGACAFQLWDFSLGNKGAWLIERGQLAYGVGILGGTAPGDTRDLAAIRLIFPTPCSTIVGHHMRIYARDLPTTTGSPFLVDFYYLLAGVETIYATSAPVYSGSFPAFSVSNLPGSALIPAPPGGAGISSIHIHAQVNYYGNSNTAVTTFDIKSVEFFS